MWQRSGIGRVNVEIDHMKAEAYKKIEDKMRLSKNSRN